MQKVKGEFFDIVKLAFAWPQIAPAFSFAAFSCDRPQTVRQFVFELNLVPIRFRQAIFELSKPEKIQTNASLASLRPLRQQLIEMAPNAIQKPILRGLVKGYLVRSLLISSAIAITGGYAYKVLVADPRKKAYADFYKDYDAEAEGERMYRMGVIRSWNDNEDVPEEKYKLPF